ncbi:putative bifunctional diguanylate cyclase/phosphodiesterase [Novosphingopyxis sp.]|uniref:putative bifunctional diguanylate cyclase/phosphodiesterase n=1 Tax=Novosphingopyxis sp. TaxID=2709690 RepID=UPI003B595DC7
MTELLSDMGQAHGAPMRALLGIARSDEMDWGHVRAVQMRGMRANALLRLAANLLAVLTIGMVFFRAENILLIAGWSLAMAVMQLHNYRSVLRGDFADRKSVSLRELQRIQLQAILPSLLWAAALLYIGLYGSIEQLVILYSIILLMLVGSATVVAAVPLATMILVSVTGLCAAAAFVLAGAPIMAACGMGVSLLLIIAALQSARNHVGADLARINLQEKNETVSLLLREFEDSGADWLWQTDTARRVARVSPRFAYALGRDAAEIDGLPLLQLVAGEAWESGDFPAALHMLADKLNKREPFSNLLVPVYLGDRQLWWELSASPRLGEDGNFLGFRGVGSDVTTQQESQKKISHLARFDTLTGLPNRLQLTESLGEAMREADKWRSRCCFLMIDLDRFKAVNDTLGHPVGDRLLGRVSKRLQSIMSENELCGRLGGDEFAVVVKDGSDSAYVTRLADRIIEVLSKPYEVDQHTLFIGASVGAAVGPRDGKTVEMLMRSADLALYRSKDAGGGSHTLYQPSLHADAEERRVMEIELRKALERGELYLQYQPVVDAEEYIVTGFEALLRWNSEKFGPVSPAKFIPLAEDTRLIASIGEWVLAQACRDAAQWPDMVNVAVNVSADQLTVPNFIDTVTGALEKSGLPTRRLEIEVTESIFVRGGMAEKMLARVLDLGIKLSLDDFGTGYSSLGYLSKTRFDTIKVDRSFVQGAANNVPESIAIIRAVVAMADSLGMSTTAEGVENEDELKMIQALGCKKIQGYYFGRPMSFEDASALFHQSDMDVA